VTLLRGERLRNRQLLGKQSPAVTVMLHVNGVACPPARAFPVAAKGGRDPEWAPLASGPGTVLIPVSIVRRIALGRRGGGSLCHCGVQGATPRGLLKLKLNVL
jgi:hypothetical protein